MLLLRSPACWSAWYSPTGSFAGCIPPRGRAPSPSLGTRGGAGRLDQRAADAAYIRPRSIGEVAEWPKAPDSKSGLGASPTWVRLPPSPRRNNQLAPPTRGNNQVILRTRRNNQLALRTRGNKQRALRTRAKASSARRSERRRVWEPSQGSHGCGEVSEWPKE